LTCCISHTTCCWRRFIRVCDLFIYFHVQYYNNCFLLTQKITQFFHAHRYIQIKKSFDDIIIYIVSNSKHWFTVIIMQLFGRRQHCVFFLNELHPTTILVCLKKIDYYDNKMYNSWWFWYTNQLSSDSCLLIPCVIFNRIVQKYQNTNKLNIYDSITI